MSVVGVAVRGEYHHSVEDGGDPPLCFGHGCIPQLQMAAVLLFPVLVQIDQGVEAAIKIINGVFAEIGVDGELAAGNDLMQSAALVLRVAK